MHRDVNDFNGHYRSGRDDLGRDFFGPALQACSEYCRAVGYFSSSSLATWAHILPSLVNSDTIRIKLLASPVLSREDRATLASVATEQERTAIRQQLADRIVEEALTFAAAPTNGQARDKILAWMIASGRLEFRFAFAAHAQSDGLFHEKIGIFVFPNGRKVAFTGSANETLSGHSNNYESIDVFRSWIPQDAERVTVKEGQFSEAWSGAAPGLKVVGLSPDAIARIRLRAPREPGARSVPVKNLWRHQDEALARFLAIRRGILEMATGTGKTRTALRICQTLIEAGQVDTVIVTADGTDLLDQWQSQILALTQSIEHRYSVVRHYAGYHERSRFELDPRRRVLLVSRPALAPALRALSRETAARTLLIHDEVHRLGSPGNREHLQNLSDQIQYRLGLSATPEREYDDDGNAFVIDHVGPVIYKFGLENAIQRGILAPFSYHPIPYVPDEEDRQRIQQVHKRAAAREAEGHPMTKEEVWIELAKVYKTSRTKIPLFDAFIEQHQHLLRRCIVFVETIEYGEEVLEVIHKYRSDFHTYFASEDSEVLRRFASGEVECLLTCHRLSEGIDIRNLETVILFSSARARLETIQRMGRCLRVDPQNPEKRANVVDFVRADAPDATDPNADTLRQVWLEELSHVEKEKDM